MHEAGSPFSDASGGAVRNMATIASGAPARVLCASPAMCDMLGSTLREDVLARAHIWAYEMAVEVLAMVLLEVANDNVINSG